MSTAALTGKANETIYCAAKWGARGFTEALRQEMKGSKVRVISVYPSGIKTPFWNEQCGVNIDTSQFMEPDEVAQTIVANIIEKKSLYLSEITINKSLA